MSLVDRSGSEKFPIDLTQDDSPDGRESKKRRSMKKNFQTIKRRIKRLETEIKEPQMSNEFSGASTRFLSQDEAANFVSQCQDLKSRLGVLETWAESMCQIFGYGQNDGEVNVEEENTFHISGAPDDEGLVVDEITIPMAEASVEHQEQEKTDFNFPSVHAHIATDNLMSSGLKQNLTQDDQTSDKIHDTVNVGSNLSCHQASDSVSNRTDAIDVPCWAVLEQHQCAESDSNLTMDEHFQDDDNDQDIKPDLQTVYEKINLWRDDQGRILMFLYCTAKRLRPNSNLIAGVSGMYLIDELHNEFGFLSHQGMKDVKIEAEIRAALFGLETIKCIFKESLDDLCVMIISSCPVLVQAMKTDRVYPRFYSCSCQFLDCEHSGNRWITDHPIGKSHIDILPDLMVSMKSLRVHWCKLDNVTDEEKQVVNAYRNVVDVWLTEYIKAQRRKFPALPQTAQTLPRLI